MQQSGRQAGLQLSPECDDQVFRGWDYATQKGDIQVEIPVVYFFEDSFLNDSVKLVQIDNKPGIRMRLTSHGHLEHIVVPVPIGAEALPKRLYIPCLTLGGIMETMRGVKEHAARDVDSAHDLCVEGGSRMPP